jgi:maltose phosphorylase
LIAIARFWHQRANFFDQENQYASRVTGPNEYENNVNNNFTPIIQVVFRVYLWSNSKVSGISFGSQTHYRKVKSLIESFNLGKNLTICTFQKNYNVYLQQDGFLDKDLVRGGFR